MNIIKEGYKATITDEEGTVCDVIQLGGYNLEKPLARADIIDKIQDALPSEAFDPPAEGGGMAGKPWLPVFDPLGMVEKLTENMPLQLKDPIRQMFKGSSNPSAGRYAELPEICRCQECGYEAHNPGQHCPQLGPCPKCGSPRLWRVK